MVQCLVETIKATSFEDAVSDCQYIHKVGVDKANIEQEL